MTVPAATPPASFTWNEIVTFIVGNIVQDGRRQTSLVTCPVAGSRTGSNSTDEGLGRGDPGGPWKATVKGRPPSPANVSSNTRPDGTSSTTARFAIGAVPVLVVTSEN